ncbi:MAG: Uma2 family endonuclease [Cyanobacteria bacterium CRU_2_1]|nr:Uma2 family endonuclease [Cyanobacteria bacterium RU_5_0]NJR57781.1 Uma2 family endonuclease [Cyanobacteria bacterium CRU_2_1]
MLDIDLAKQLAEHGVTLPPTQAELPYDDGVPMETQRHKLQMDVLLDTLQPWLDARSDGYIGGNMFVYYSMTQVRNRDFKGPDFFAVLGVPKGERLSWVIWEEDKAPDVVIELLSDSTATQDKNEKKLIYQDRMRVPEYFWFDPFNPNDWAGFSLQQGVYQPIVPNAQNQLVSQSLGLALVRWQGNHKGIDTIWLRWETPNGELLPTAQEIAKQEQRQVEQERQRAEQAESRLRQVVLNLLQTGMTVAQVAQVTGLTDSQIRGWAEQ